MEKKVYWLHSYTISGGKNAKSRQTIHIDEKKALENQVLFGGTVMKLQEV